MRFKSSTKVFLALFLALMLLAVPVAALADQTYIDTDLAKNGKQSSVDLIATAGSIVTTSGQIVIERNGGKHLNPGDTVVFEVNPAGTNLPSGYGVDNCSITIPTLWNTNGQTVSGNSSISFTAPSAPGSYQYSVTWREKVEFSDLNGVPDLTINLTVTAPPDTIAPTTTHTLSAQPNENGWNKTNVTVNLSATDNPGGSGVKQTIYSASGAQNISPTTINGSSAVVNLTVEGITTVSYHAVDNRNNIGETKSVTVRIDETAPLITGEAVTQPNSNGWYNTDVVVAFSASDSGSGIASVSPNTTLVADGALQSVRGTATDLAGNSANCTVSGINIDKTAPVITAIRDHTPNGYGWNNTDVTISFNATDNLSGIAAVSGPSTFGEGASQSVTGTATDLAGNSASLLVDGINVDKTFPEASAVATTQANENGWYKDDVIVHFSGSDALSGIGSVSPDMTLSAEGQGLSATGTVIDRAGNSVSVTLSAINIDKTAPEVAFGEPSPLANAAGWNNTNVSIPFTAVDTLSGMATVESGTIDLSDEGASVTGQVTAVDLAGNTKTFTSPIVKIDKTAPVIAGSRLPLANSFGWNNEDVTVTFEASDGLSGIASVTQPVTVSNEGVGQSVTGTVVDLAGNSADVTVSNINIDKTAPTITGAPTTQPNGNGWYREYVTVSFTGNDGLSGLDSLTPDTTIETEGAGQFVTGTAVDKAGNSAAYKVEGINIDVTAPEISGSRAPLANDYGWNNEDVTASFTATDNLSGIVDLTGSTTVSTEGENQSVVGTATDLAGNSASVTVGGISIDKTAPEISGVPDREPNEYGWYKNDVTISWVVSDALSQIDPLTVPADEIITGEGDNLGAGPATVSDKAGNSASASVTGIKIDRTAPSISGTPTTLPNANGWYRTDVTVHFDGDDSLSGLKSLTEDTLVSAEAAGQSVTGTAEDYAGNSASFTVGGINLDKTAPSIMASRMPEANSFGWNNQDVVVSFEVSDALSGVVSAPGSVTLGQEGAGQSATGTVTDLAGNSASATIAGVNIDKTGPEISGAATAAPNSNGWYNTDVTIAWSTFDELSGIDPATDPADSVITGEGSNLGAGPAIVSDKAGNSARASVSGINIDRTAPSLTLSRPVDGAAYTLGQAVSADYAGDDALSGISSVTGTVPTGGNIDTGSIGKKTFTVTCVDQAGNSYTKTVTYNVTYAVKLLFDNTKPVKSGACIPIKLQLSDAVGANVSSSSIVLHATSVTRISTNADGPVQDAGNANPDNDFRFTGGTGDSAGYIFNLKTTGYKTGTYLLKFTAGDDATVYTVQFEVK